MDFYERVAEIGRRVFDKRTQDADDLIRELTAEALDRNPEEEDAARQLLKRAATHRDVLVRMAAVEGLGEIGTGAEIDVLSNACGDEDWAVRASAYSSLANAVGRGSARIIEVGLTDPNPIVRRYAAVALFDASGCDAVPRVSEAAARDDDPYARVGYVGVLATCGDQAALEELKGMAKSQDRRISSPAAEALQEIAEMEGKR